MTEVTVPQATSSSVPPGTSRRWEEQRSFDELGRALREVTFCVVDLETTGGSASSGDRITEIGAVKVRGGEVIAEFATLVNPETDIPAFIAVLTGISNAMVAGSPRIDQVLPAFLEFARGTVLVAHNAPFDVGFLKHETRRMSLTWPRFEVIDTVFVARRAVHRDETANYKLSSLATLFGAATTPTHRALADARATVDVLHGLIGRLGNLGVHTMEELSTYSAKVTPAQRRKRHLAEGLPHEPGVYLFRDSMDRVLYVGTSRDLRTRVRGYFTASETRSRMGQMVNLADRVDSVVCSTTLEAAVYEIRLIAEHKPRFNRRSRFPERVHWVKLTVEPWPRLALVRRPLDDGAAYLGPYSSSRAAKEAIEALHDTFPVRRCSPRLARLPTASPCALAEMGRCLSPCDQSVTAWEYAELIDALRGNLTSAPRDVVDHAHRRLDTLCATERFEEAGRTRDRLVSFLRGAARLQRLGRFAACPEVVAARQERGRWSVHVIRFGRLVAAGVIPAGVDAMAWVDQLRAGAETPQLRPGPLPACTAEEAGLVLGWVESPGTRLVHLEGTWDCPLDGAVRDLERHDVSARSRHLMGRFEG